MLAVTATVGGLTAASLAGAATMTFELANATTDGKFDTIRGELSCDHCEAWFISSADYLKGDYNKGGFQLSDGVTGTVDGTIVNRDVLNDGKKDNDEKTTRVELFNTILGASYTFGDRKETGGNQTSWTSSAKDIMIWLGNDEGFRYVFVRNYKENNSFTWKSVGGAGGKSGYDGYGHIDPNPIPLPAAGWLLIAGLGGLAAVKRRKAA